MCSQARADQPAGHAATVFFSCFGKGLEKVGMDLTILSPFLCCCSFGCVFYFNIGFRKCLFPPNISPILPDFNLSPTCRNSHFFGSWLVFFGVGFLQVRKSLETVSKAWLETCGFQLYQISQDLPAFAAIIWAPSPSPIQFPLFHGSSPKCWGRWWRPWISVQQSMAFWLGTPLLVVFVSVTSFFWMG